MACEGQSHAGGSVVRVGEGTSAATMTHLPVPSAEQDTRSSAPPGPEPGQRVWPAACLWPELKHTPVSVRPLPRPGPYFEPVQWPSRPVPELTTDSAKQGRVGGSEFG